MDLHCHCADSVRTYLFLPDILVPRSVPGVVCVVLDERTFYSSPYTINGNRGKKLTTKLHVGRQGGLRSASACVGTFEMVIPLGVPSMLQYHLLLRLLRTPDPCHHRCYHRAVYVLFSIPDHMLGGKTKLLKTQNEENRLRHAVPKPETFSA